MKTDNLFEIISEEIRELRKSNKNIERIAIAAEQTAKAAEQTAKAAGQQTQNSQLMLEEHIRWHSRPIWKKWIGIQ